MFVSEQFDRLPGRLLNMNEKMMRNPRFVVWQCSIERVVSLRSMLLAQSSTGRLHCSAVNDANAIANSMGASNARKNSMRYPFIDSKSIH